jgi:hypothetical protein
VKIKSYFIEYEIEDGKYGHMDYYLMDISAYNDCANIWEKAETVIKSIYEDSKESVKVFAVYKIDEIERKVLERFFSTI